MEAEPPEPGAAPQYRGTAAISKSPGPGLREGRPATLGTRHAASLQGRTGDKSEGKAEASAATPGDAQIKTKADLSESHARACVQ